MSDTPATLQELRDELNLLASRIQEAQEDLRAIEEAVEAYSKEGEYIPSFEQAQSQMNLVEDLNLEYLHTQASNVSSLFQELYDSARDDQATARNLEIKAAVVSLVTEKTGEVGIAEIIAHEVGDLNES